MKAIKAFLFLFMIGLLSAQLAKSGPLNLASKASKIVTSEQEEIEKLVTNFFTAYSEWNKFSHDYSVKYPGTWQINSSPPQRRYDAIIAKYCVRGKNIKA